MLGWQISRVEKLILLGASILIAVSLVFLLRGERQPEPSKKGEYAGTIVTLENDVRRRTPESLIWIGANVLDPLNFHDSVFTGEQSEAWIELDKVKIHLEPPKSAFLSAARS